MQVEEESPKQYVDIARAPDKEMRPDRPVPPGCGQDGRLLRYPSRPYRHMAFVGRLAYGPSWPQRITRPYMKWVLVTLCALALAAAHAVPAGAVLTEINITAVEPF